MSRLAKLYYINNVIKVLRYLDLERVRKYLIEGVGERNEKSIIKDFQSINDILSDVKAKEIASCIYMSDVKRLVSLALEYMVVLVYGYESNQNYKGSLWDFKIKGIPIDLKVAYYRRCSNVVKREKYKLRALDVLVDFRDNEFQLLENVVMNFSRENIDKLAKKMNDSLCYELGFEYDIIENEKSLDIGVSRL